MRLPTRILSWPLRKLRALTGSMRSRSPALRCLACGALARRCLCLAGPMLEEQIDQSDRPTLRESVRAKAVVPGPPKPPSVFPRSGKERRR